VFLRLKNVIFGYDECHNSFKAFLTSRLKYVTSRFAFQANFIALFEMKFGDSIQTQDL
jgi:hypothetical protein